MKKTIIIITSFIACAVIILFSCTKKDEAVTPVTTKTNNINVGTLRISVTDENISLSSAKVEGTDYTPSIIIVRRGPLTINKVTVGPSGSSVITRITVTPSDKIATQTSGEGCPSLEEITGILNNTINSSSTASAGDICKFLSFFKCLIQNPTQYGIDISDIDRFSLSSDEISTSCQYLNCAACSGLSNVSGNGSSSSSSSSSSSNSSSSTSNQGATGSFKFDGKTYNGSFGSCSVGSQSQTYTLYTSNSEFITASISSSYKSVTVYVNGTYYNTSSSNPPTITVDGSTTTISATVKSSDSSSSASSITVTATINCN